MEMRLNHRILTKNMEYLGKKLSLIRFFSLLGLGLGLGLGHT